MKRRTRIAAAGAALLLALAACGGSDDSGSGSPTPTGQGSGPGATGKVTVKNLAFSPASITVTAGTAVTWTNEDTFPHTVTSGSPDDAPSGLFDGPLESTGSSFTFAFPTAGTFDYYCKIHPQMIGTVTVT